MRDMTHGKRHLVKRKSRARWQARSVCCTFWSGPSAGCFLEVPVPAEAGCASCPSPASMRDAWMACTSIASLASLQAQAHTLMLGLQMLSVDPWSNWGAIQAEQVRVANPEIAQTSECGKVQA